MERGTAPPRRTGISQIASFFTKQKKIDNFKSPKYSAEELDELQLRRLSLTHIFSVEELDKATNGFQDMIGEGAFGKVYLGELVDKKMVAVKELKEDDQKLHQHFFNEVEVLSRLSHPNLVALHGCTKPPEELFLVYEFVPNGTLENHLHGKLEPLPWNKRLHIAIETAEALAFLHSSDPVIIHRDLKPANILLDHSFRAKVADFGLCQPLASKSASTSTLTQGTMGYMGPEHTVDYLISGKTDVYSFGVVLLELVSGKLAVDVLRGPDSVYLANLALNLIGENKIEQLVDPELGYHSVSGVSRMINPVIKLAQDCLHREVQKRPPMAEVLNILKNIQNDLQDLRGQGIREDEVGDVDRFYQEAPHDEIQGAINHFDSRQRLGLATVFSYEELKEATNSFDASGLLFEEAFSSTYLGKLQDGQMVAIKVLYDNHPRLLEQFYNEVTVLSLFGHQNLINVRGCTSPLSQKLLIVYEFVPNGSVADHLVGQRAALTWAVRIQIAIETAEALRYLHSLKTSIIHRDVKSSNILLDDTFHIKVTGLDICYFLPWDTTYAITPPLGTMGYQDPDCYLNCRLNDKSDVYSFGVILLELVSGKRAIDVNRDESDIYLANMASNKILTNELEHLVDPELSYHSDCAITSMINSVVDLACRCLEPEGDVRPSMAEVLTTLKEIKDGAQQTQP